MLSAAFALPLIGRFYDQGITARLTEGVTQESLKAAGKGSELAAQWITIQAGAGLEALGQVAILPVVLTVIFALLLVTSRKPASAH